MEHRPLGRTGVSVSKLCLGAMMFGAWGNPDHEDSIRIIHAALDAGIDFIDTADVYSQGESEEIVSKALVGGKRDQVVLATKFWGQMGEGANRTGASRRWIVEEVENSLRRLGTDYIDLYQVHRPSSCSTTPPSPRRSSGRAPWSSSKASCPPRTSSCRPTCSTASTRSSRPASTSTPPTAAGRARPWSLRRGAARSIVTRPVAAGDPAPRGPRPRAMNLARGEIVAGISAET
jgi:hypothetical protein